MSFEDIMRSAELERKGGSDFFTNLQDADESGEDESARNSASAKTGKDEPAMNTNQDGTISTSENYV